MVFTVGALDHVVTAPSSVLTEDGKVWTVDDQSLQLEQVEVLEERASSVLFRYLERPTERRLLVQFPLTSFLQGRSVSAIGV